MHKVPERGVFTVLQFVLSLVRVPKYGALRIVRSSREVGDREIMRRPEEAVEGTPATP